MGSIPGWWTKTPHATWHGQKFLQSVVFNFQRFVSFPVVLLLLISNFLSLWSERILYMILPFKSIETIYGLTYASCYTRMTHVHVQRMCTLLFVSKVLCMCLLEPVGWSTDWLTALVKSSISLLTFSPVVLSISERAVLKSPTIIINYLFSPFNFAHFHFCFLYFDNLL